MFHSIAVRYCLALSLAGALFPARFSPKDNAEMVYIPAGEFLMGSAPTSADFGDDKPPHRVYLKDYWIYKNLL